MNQLMNNVQSSVNIAVLVDNKLIGGQLGASLSRSASAIDITNKINGEWQNNLLGVKTWQITCNGLYIKDAAGFSALEDAFMNNNSIKVQMTIGDTKSPATRRRVPCAAKLLWLTSLYLRYIINSSSIL